jgi:predicted enzyme related to lactoylglutathione lyase
MGAPVVHFEIMGGKGAELETFYSELFDWSINSNNPLKYGSSIPAARREASTAESAPLMTAASVFRSMPGLAICKQRWTKRRN